MSTNGQSALATRRAELEARLAAPGAAVERDQLKNEIIALYKSVDSELAELSALKEAVRQLVERWKSLPAPTVAATHGARGVPGAARASAPTPPRSPMQADHLGASTYIEKGWSLIAAGDFVNAEIALERALELAPHDVHAESLLGWAQMLQERFDPALLNLQKVLMREPANALARVNLGYICLKKHIFGEAIEHLSRAIRLDNDRKATLYAHFYMGLVYLEREMFDDAQGFLRKAIELGPNLTEAWYQLGHALWFAGNREAALQAWRDGYNAGKLGQWGKRCEEMSRLVEAGGAPVRSS